MVGLWDIATLAPVAPGTSTATNEIAKSQKPGIKGLGISPDGRVVVVSEVDDRIIIYDAKTSAPLQKFATFSGDAVAFSLDAKLLVSYKWDDMLCWWDAVSLDLLHRVGLPKGSIHRAMAISPDNKRIAASHSGNVACHHIYLYDAKKGEKLWVREGCGNGVKAIAFSPDSKRVAIGTDLTVSLWDVATGEMMQEFPIRGSNIRALAFSKDNEKLTMQSLSLRSWTDTLVELTTNTTLRTLSEYGDFPQLVLCGTEDDYLGSKQSRTASHEPRQFERD
ncbi:Quino protein amine dehydrogenase [Xylaria longipes]|nr:Quino protein amine dehydrogenase [Xylaria longipes]